MTYTAGDDSKYILWYICHNLENNNTLDKQQQCLTFYTLTHFSGLSINTSLLFNFWTVNLLIPSVCCVHTTSNGKLQFDIMMMIYIWCYGIQINNVGKVTREM